LIKIKEWVDKNDPGAQIIPFSGIFESKIFDMDDATKEAYFKEQGATRYDILNEKPITLYEFYSSLSALDKIIVTGFKALQLIYFFTAGADEVKAWTVQVSKLIVHFDGFHYFFFNFRKQAKLLKLLDAFTRTLRKASSWLR
jgi:ribosome-binding ATPase YchF (GTP1/OBG family)